MCACQNDGPHTFHTPAPVPARAPAPAPQAPATEVPLGANGPEARILAVVDSATGAPVTLTNLTAPFSVMTVVARGPGQWMPDASARIELELRGPTHTVLALPLAEPTPVIIAHAFTVGRSGASGGLPTGNYLMQVKLLMRESTVLATSVPLYLTVK
ncbi:MAG TPA: hypothetical protein VF929_01655 [Gemmatimonadaceae bacterium]